jgi:hypothetical protein
VFQIRIQTDKKTVKKEKSSVAADKTTIFVSKIAVYLSLGLHKGRSSSSRSLIPQKQGWKKPGFFLKKPSPVGFFGFFWVFCFFFGFFWVFLPGREGF